MHRPRVERQLDASFIFLTAPQLYRVANQCEPLIFGVGIHGQFLFVDPIKKISIAWFSSQDIPLDGSRFEATLKIVEEIRALI